MTFLEHDITFDECFPKVNKQQMYINYFKRIYHMVHRQNFTFLAMMVGRFRSGKSHLAVNFADLLDKDFTKNMESRICYLPSQFLNTLKEIRENNTIGSCVIFDEAGVSYGSRDWYQFINKLVGREIQIMAYLRPIIFFVSLDISFLDSQPRKLLNCVYEISRSGNKYCAVRPFFLQNNPWKGKIYRHYPIFVEKHDGAMTPTYKMKRLYVPDAPKHIIDQYEEISRKYKNTTLDELHQEVDDFEKSKKSFIKAPNIDELVDVVVLNFKNYEAPRSTPEKKRVSREIIRHDLNVTEYKSRVIQRKAEIILNR